MFVYRLAWVSIAALGEPAVPEVKIMTAMSPGSRSRTGAEVSPSRSSSASWPSGTEPPSGVNPAPMTNSRSGTSLRSSSAIAARPAGPTTTARASTLRSSRVTAATGFVGLSGTATNPAPSAARYDTTK